MEPNKRGEKPQIARGPRRGEGQHLFEGISRGTGGIGMNEDSTDFMLAEYERILAAYFQLQVQVTDWFKAYLTLIGFPLTVLAAALKFSGSDISGSLTGLPDVIAALLIAVSVLGFFVTVSVTTMRMEMILYARTINAVRRFFGKGPRRWRSSWSCRRRTISRRSSR